MLNRFHLSLVTSLLLISCTIEEPDKQKTPILNQIPFIVITTHDTIVKESYTNMMLEVNYNGFDNCFDTYSYNGAIRVRGNSTASQPKKPYKLKISSKPNIFGMGNENKWVLLANYFDVTLLRNHIANKIGKALKLKSTPDGVFVDVFLNQEYVGNYYLTEQIELSKNRVQGQIVFEVDHKFHDDEVVIRFPDVFEENGLPYVFKDPEKPTSEQFNFYESYLQNFYNQIDSYATEGYKIDTYQFNELIVPESWFAYHIVQELFKNPDAWSFSSIYFTITDDDRIYMGPLWDFDLSAGNYSALDPDHHDIQKFNDPQGAYIFTNMFVKAVNISYYSQFKEYWNNNKDTILSVINSIDSEYETIKLSSESNFQKWSVGNYRFNNQCENTLDDNVDYLKHFLIQRYHWMDEYINNIQNFQ